MNKTLPLAVKEFTFMSIRTNVKKVTSINTCVSRKNVVNVMDQMIAGDVSPTNRIIIDERPSIVNKKLRVGDWKGYALIGKGHRGVVATLVERKTQYAILAKFKTTQVRQTVEQALTSHKSQFHTIPYDNGLEFSEHQKMAQMLSTNIYFPHPYSS
jgi:IS30 family transposase